MRLVEEYAAREILRRTPERDAALVAHCKTEIDDALSSRKALDQMWTESLSQYEAIPRNPMRVPMEMAPNIAVPLGAIANDAIEAQFIDLIFNIQPTLTCRAVHTSDEAMRRERDANTKVLQSRVNHGIGSNEWGFRAAVEGVVQDTTKLGTGCFYTGMLRRERKTDITRVKERGAYIRAWPIEDVIFPGGAYGDVQLLRWTALRSWLTLGELTAQAKAEGRGKAAWDISQCMPTPDRGFVRSKRELLGRSRKQSTDLSSMYEVIRLWIDFDYNDDEEDESLYVVFDRSSGALIHAGYDTCDRRYLSPAVYNKRAYLIYGQGVLEMSRPGENVVSELMTHALINVILANCKMWVTRPGVGGDDWTVYPNKRLEDGDPATAVKELEMSSTHPDIQQYIAMNIGLVERRVGVNEMSLPRPSQVLGSRTPGITALSLLQQVNRRFTPAFDNMRLAAAESVRHCLYREQECLMAGDREMEDYLIGLLGDEDGARYVKLLRDPRFDEQVTVELTASSASSNRQADRQDMLMLFQSLAPYYEKTVILMQIAENPQTPEGTKQVCRKVATIIGNFVERIAATFDQVRDPEDLVVRMDKEMDAAITSGDMAIVASAMANMAGGQPPMAGAAPGEEAGGNGGPPTGDAGGSEEMGPA